ncbi:MAG: YtxH domain-containing protein [Ktedonobacteraceae bacterium]|nr:YtxH domain-containing protein [Ktedonobacteraceae bacterium]
MVKLPTWNSTQADTIKESGDKARHKAQRTYTTARNAAQATYETTRDTALRTYANVQSNMQSTVRKASLAIAALLGLLQGQLSYNRKKRGRNWKKIRKQTQKNLRFLQGTVQDTIQPAWSKTQDAIQTGMGTAQALFTKQARSAQENLRKAQENLKAMQAALQENLSTGMTTAQTLLSRGSRQAQQNLSQAASSARDLGDTLQKQFVRYQRRRQRARTLFRWGLIAGIVVALLYTPVPGSEVRRRIAEQWQRYRSYFGLA